MLSKYTSNTLEQLIVNQTCVNIFTTLLSVGRTLERVVIEAVDGDFELLTVKTASGDRTFINLSQVVEIQASA